MEGLEIVMDIETLEIFEVINHDKTTKHEVELENSDFSDSNMIIQLNLFDSMNMENSS